MSLGTAGAVHIPVNKNTAPSGIFLHRGPPRHEQKKFGYKTRKLRHPLRHSDEQEALIQMEVAKEEDKKKFNKSNKDFVHKNKLRFLLKEQIQHAQPGSTKIKPGTVTLTQEQLAALLTSLGKKADNPLKISIDASNNKIKVENYETDDSMDNDEIRKRGQGHSFVNEKSDMSDIGIDTLLGKVNESRKPKPGEIADSNKKWQEESVATSEGQQKLHKSHNAVNQEHLSWEDMRIDTGARNVPDVVPWAHLTVGEKKRLQWARERAEAQDDYDPWGRPGAGAPMYKKEEELKPHNDGVKDKSRPDTNVNRKQKQDLIVHEIERLQKEIREAEQKKLNEIERALNESKQDERVEQKGNRLEKNRTKNERKNKAQNGSDVQTKSENKVQRSRENDGDQNYLSLDSAANLNKQESEKKKWLADLDLQRQEQRMRKQQEKERDREGIHDQFADRFVYHKTAQHISPRHEQSIVHKTNHNTRDGGFVLGQAPDNAIETNIPPAAMRSAMVTGAGTLNETRYDNARFEEKRRWLEELDRQREEQRLAKVAQKVTDKQDAGIWADRYPADHQKLRQANEILQNQSISPSENNHIITQRTNSAPHATVMDSDQSSVSPPSFLRGQGAFIDPVTRKEQEEKRRVQLEYQAQVKAQIEEKERKKREERERKMKEDMEEERKLQMDREFLNQQLEIEKRKIRAREELRHKQVAVIKSAMDDAQEKALEEKNVKRIHHLQQRGHDTSQLRAAYEASTTHVKEYEVSSLTGKGMESSREYQTYMTAPRLHSTYNIDTDIIRNDQNPLKELGNVHQNYMKEPYIEDRILTPSTYRNPSKPRDIPDSPKREFGTQTLELKDLQAILQNLPDDVQIEYKHRVEEALQDKERRKQAPPRKIHIKYSEDNNRDVNRNGKGTQPREKDQKVEERPLWNQRRRKTVIKNSEKDPFYLQKREEAELRRERRERQLLYLQELNKEKIPSNSKSLVRGLCNSLEDIKQTDERGRKTTPANKTQVEKRMIDNRDVSPNILSLLSEGDRKHVSKSPQNTERSSPPIPAVRHRAKNERDRDPYQYANSYLQMKQTDSKYGDATIAPVGDEFMPFMRTTEVLDPSKADEPVAISRENSRVERARHAYYETHHPANKGRKLDMYHDREREKTLKASQNPLLNPSLVSDHPTARQEMILQQLSSLKQTLKQRQKELENYMSPSDLQE